MKFYLREGLLPAGTATSATQATYDAGHLRRLRLVRALLGRNLLFEVVLDDRSEARVTVARGFMTAADTRSALFSAVFLVALVTLFAFWASLLS